MIPYLLLLLIPAVFPLFAYRPKVMMSLAGYNELVEKRNQMTLIMFFAGFFALLALRDFSVGADLVTYRQIFENCQMTSFGNLSEMQWELGYTIYNKLVSMISENFRVFLIVTALIVLLPIYFLYSKERRYALLSILLFINMPCFLMIFSGLRQAIAISIGVLIYLMLENKKYVLSALLFAVAVFFHSSAIVLALTYVAFFVKIKTKHLYYILPVALGIYIWRVPLFYFILDFLPSRYVEFYSDLQQTGAIGMLILFLIFCAFSFVILDEDAMSKRDYFLRNMLLISTLFQIFVPIHGWVQRASYYFLIFVPIAIVSVVQAPKRYLKNISDLAVVVMGCFFALYFFYNAAYSTDNLLDVFPYQFFWGGEGW